MADVADGAEPFAEQLRGLHGLGITAAYVMIPGPDPFTALDTLGAKVIPEITCW